MGMGISEKIGRGKGENGNRYSVGMGGSGNEKSHSRSSLYTADTLT